MLRHVLFAVLKAWTITSDRLRFPWSSPGIQKRVSRMLARLASRIHLQLRQPPRRSTWYCLLRQSACRQVVHRSRPNFVVQVKVECTRSVITGLTGLKWFIFYLAGIFLVSSSTQEGFIDVGTVIFHAGCVCLRFDWSFLKDIHIRRWKKKRKKIVHLAFFTACTLDQRDCSI